MSAANALVGQAATDASWSEIVARLNASLPAGAYLPPQGRRTADTPRAGERPHVPQRAASGQAAIDARWSAIVARLNAGLPAGAYVPPQGRRTADDGWTEALAKTRPASPILECYR